MTTDELLDRMQSLLWFNGVWHARTRVGHPFAQGATAREAMLAALGLSDEPNSDLF